ncbi:MAG TPA: sugar phosphate isomerase/epimerase [Gemmataceae bacterium]|nr:sugar phosphate isomerase/epimerase [Gemmataceae bacterium]
MQLGFVSALFPEMSLEELFTFASQEHFACIELMCWPPGAAERRYAGVTHIDVTRFNDEYAEHVRRLAHEHGVAISGLGYYPNPLDPNAEHRRYVVDHLHKVIDAAPRLGVGVVNTFIGRDPGLSVEANWPLFQAVWPDIVEHAERTGVRLGLENCPMLFSRDEWPGGKNLATSPAIWRSLFHDIPSTSLGLNFDPSHLIWQLIDPVYAVREFGSRIIHVHAKDTRIDRDRLDDVGILGLGWHTAKIPGLGDVNWGALFGALGDVGYRGAVCIEVEDRAFEGSLEDRKRALRQSKRFLEQFLS